MDWLFSNNVYNTFTMHVCCNCGSCWLKQNSSLYSSFEFKRKLFKKFFHESNKLEIQSLLIVYFRWNQDQNVYSLVHGTTHENYTF